MTRREDDEDAEDVRVAKAAWERMLAGGEVFTHAQVLARLGLSGTEKEDYARVGIISDVHGDVFALDQALIRLREMDSYPILCAGDLLDGEPFGEEVIERLKAEGVICISGNHERWALERRRRRPNMRKTAPSIVEPADLFSGGAELSYQALRWLGILPSHWAAELAGVKVAMWHARPGSDMDGLEADKLGPELRRELLDMAAADVLIVGHTHEAFDKCISAERRKIVNPGSCCGAIPAFRKAGGLLVPDGHRPATFGVLDLPSMRFRVYRAVDGDRKSVV